MFIQCSDCDYKYIVNSADLKPDGRMVECANCNHRWYQEPFQSEELLSSSVPHVPQEEEISKVKNNLQENDVNVTEEIKNLPSTVVREKKVSVLNSFLVVLILILIFLSFWLFRKYGINIFVLVDFYINEFYFNLKLIISDISKIVHKIIN